MIIVCDLDGTLVSLEGREPFLAVKDYAKFHEAGLRAKPIRSTMLILRALLMAVPDVKLHIATGRTLAFREGTMSWLAKHDLRPDELFMRPNNDKRPDVDLKAGWAWQMNRAQTLVVLEDRDRVVGMWRSLGFTCWQVANGAY